MPMDIDPETMNVDELPGIWSPVQWELTEDERIQELEMQAIASLLWTVDVPEAILRLLLNEHAIDRCFEPPSGYDPEIQGEWDESLLTFRFKRPIKLVMVKREGDRLYAEYDVEGLGTWAIELEPDQVWSGVHGKCGTCRRCIDACPTGAIVKDGVIDSRRCLSYLTIENPRAITEEIASKMDSMLFGCDICQEVCPRNKKAVLTTHRELLPESGPGEFIDAGRIVKMRTEEEFQKLTAGTALKRPKLEGLKINAEIVLRNRANSKKSNN